MKHVTLNLFGEVFNNPIVHILVLGGLVAWFTL